MDDLNTRLKIWNLNTEISKIQPFEIRKHLKSDYENRISNSPVFKESGYSSFYSYGPNHLKSGHFFQISNGFWQNVGCSDFKGWASRFQIPYEIWTICKQTSFRPKAQIKCKYSRHSVIGHSVTGNIQLTDIYLSDNRMSVTQPSHSVTGRNVR